MNKATAEVIAGPWPKNSVENDSTGFAAYQELKKYEAVDQEIARDQSRLTKFKANNRAEWVKVVPVAAAFLYDLRYTTKGKKRGQKEWAKAREQYHLENNSHLSLLIRMGANPKGTHALLNHPHTQSVCSIATLAGNYTSLCSSLLFQRDEDAHSGKTGSHKNNPLANQDRWEEVAKLFPVRTVQAIAKAIKIKGNEGLWKLILNCLDVGFILENNYRVIAHQRHPTLRLLFPATPIQRPFFSKINFYRPQDTQYVRNVIWPIALANKEAVLKNPLVLEKLVTEHEQAVTKKKHEILRMDFAKAETAKAIAALPTDQPPIKMYGKDIWPSPFYEWDDVREGCLLFIALLRLLQDSPHHTTPHAKARMVRMTGRMLPRYCAKLWQVCLAIAAAYEADPQGECKPAEEPKNGAWVRR